MAVVEALGLITREGLGVGFSDLTSFKYKNGRECENEYDMNGSKVYIVCHL